MPTETTQSEPGNTARPNASFKNGVQFAWDATTLKLAEECPRKYKYLALEGWRHSNKSAHLLFGGWFATALEHYYKHVALGDDWQEALEKVVLEALVNSWIKESPEDPGRPWVSEHNAKTRENLIRTIVWYVDQFKDEAIKVVRLPDGKPAVEYTFALSVDNGIIFTGHIDRLVEFVDTLYVMDQKTTQSVITPLWFRQFAPDIQMSMYTFAGRAIYNMPVKGVIIDGAQIAVGFSRFERGFTFRSDDQLHEWYDEMMHLIEVTQAYTREDFFPMNTSSCGNYGGCQFRSICSRGPAVRRQFLEAEFTQGPTWDPLQKR